MKSADGDGIKVLAEALLAKNGGEGCPPKPLASPRRKGDSRKTTSGRVMKATREIDPIILVVVVVVGAVE